MPIARTRITRRCALTSAAVAALLAAVPPLARTPLGGAEALAQRLLRIFRDPAAAAVIGHAYLRDRPDESHPERLLALLLDRQTAAANDDASNRRVVGVQESQAGESAGQLSSTLCPGSEALKSAHSDMADLHAWMRERTRGDFAAGRTVWVDGVLLARTEARLYALAAMT